MAKTTSFQVYQDKKGEFRFNLIAKNGEPVAQSSEGYKTKAACMGAVKKMREWTATDVIEVVDRNAKKAPAKKAVAKKVAKLEVSTQQA